ncbi:MAG: hypothetical protein ACJ8FY_11350 [Gemmataceae bacterium]
MRALLVTVALLVAGLDRGTVQAQTVLYQARVKPVETDVRSGPSLDAKMYPTNRLKRGEVVRVVKEEEGDWLGIVPPAGSFSWINQLVVEPGGDKTPNLWMVSDDNAQVYYGSELWKEQPNIISAKLARGTLLTSVGRPFTRQNTGGVWVPIKPPPSEVRYVLAKDLEKVDGMTSPTPAPVVKAAPVGRGSVGEPSDPNLPPSPQEAPAATLRIPPDSSTVSPVPDSRIAEAQRAERLGDRQKAINLWIEVGREYEKSNNLKLRDQCYSRADWLKQQTRPPALAANGCCVPCTPLQQRCWPSTMDNRLTAVPASRIQPVATQPNANTSPRTRAAEPVSWNPARIAPLPDANQINPLPSGTNYRGYLTSAKSVVDGKRTYLLQSHTGELIAYVVGEPGVDLDRNVLASVEVQGTLSYRSDLRGNLLKAASIQPLRQP